ncbi:MAG: hypothetical protein KDK33_01775 [Leptospiraceae bacterium]|nr:hypothetical protein [Leptospiraceae bacterium]
MGSTVEGLSRILADPNRDLIGVMANGLVVVRNRQADSGEPSGRPGAPNSDREENLSESERKLLEELKDRDREVRLHEQKHLAAAGTLAKGGPKFEYTIGPDGKPYAIGGHVSIDTSNTADPEENRARANQIQRAAAAPGHASAQDRSVIADAQHQASMAYRQNAPDATETNGRSGYALKLWG